MAKGVELSLILFIAVIGLAVAPAVLAESGDAAQAREKPQAIAAAKERAPEKQAAAQEKAQVKKENVQTRVQDKIETLKAAVEGKKDSMQEKAQERRKNAREAAQEKREALRAKVADSDLGKVEALDRARLKEVEGLTPEEAKARLAKLRVVKADENFKIRPIADAAKEARKKAFEKLKEDEKTLKGTYKERLDSLKEAKERLRSCGNETQSDDCTKIRTDAVEKAKEAALKAVDRIVTHLQKLKDRIEGSENMPEEEVAEKVARIDALLSEIEVIKQKISVATTKEELNAAVKELKDAVKEVKRASEAHSQGLLRAEINGVIHRSEVIEKKLDCALDGMEDNSTDTSAVDDKLAEFSSKISAAREKLEQAKELLASEDDTKIAEGKNLIREARDMVQEAHRLLEEVRKDIRGLGGQPCHGEQEIAVEQEEGKNK
ncbi:hypothetical protein HYU40_04435 [Candidatus Woesearchaeota archaeon]|nr:hypothetical protein [Candidatus Woesearchaeota archaeon]